MVSSALSNVISNGVLGWQLTSPHCQFVTASSEYVVAVWIDALVVVRGPSADGVRGPIEISMPMPFGSGATCPERDPPAGLRVLDHLSDLVVGGDLGVGGEPDRHSLAGCLQRRGGEHGGGVDALVERRDEHLLGVDRRADRRVLGSERDDARRRCAERPVHGSRQRVPGLRLDAGRDRHGVRRRHRKAVDVAPELEAQGAHADPAPPSRHRGRDLHRHVCLVELRDRRERHHRLTERDAEVGRDVDIADGLVARDAQRAVVGRLRLRRGRRPTERLGDRRTGARTRQRLGWAVERHAAVGGVELRQLRLDRGDLRVGEVVAGHDRDGIGRRRRVAGAQQDPERTRDAAGAARRRAGRVVPPARDLVASVVVVAHEADDSCDEHDRHRERTETRRPPRAHASASPPAQLVGRDSTLVVAVVAAVHGVAHAVVESHQSCSSPSARQRLARAEEVGLGGALGAAEGTVATSATGRSSR